MGLFRPYSSDDKPSKPETVEPAVEQTEAEVDSKAPAKKDRPTPTRKQAEYARQQRLHPTLSKKERKKRERAVEAANREKTYAQIEMRPERVLLRNFIDARWTLSEFTWPVMFIGLAMILASSYAPILAYIANWLVWAVIVVIVLESTYLWYRYKNLLCKRLDNYDKRGLVMYMVARMITMRRFRRPAAALDRGAKY